MNNCKGPSNFFQNVYQKKKMSFMEVKDQFKKNVLLLQVSLKLSVIHYGII